MTLDILQLPDESCHMSSYDAYNAQRVEVVTEIRYAKIAAKIAKMIYDTHILSLPVQLDVTGCRS